MPIEKHARFKHVICQVKQNNVIMSFILMSYILSFVQVWIAPDPGDTGKPCGIDNDFCQFSHWEQLQHVSEEDQGVWSPVCRHLSVSTSQYKCTVDEKESEDGI